MSARPLIEYVHPDVVYRRVPLAAEHNGLALLHAANESVVNEDDEIGYLFYAEEGCECGAADCLSCNCDDATFLRKLTAVLKKNTRSLELYAQVLAEGRLQFPAPRSGPWLGGSESDWRRELDQLKALEMRWARIRGDLASAARAIRERAQFAAIIGRGEGTLSNYILHLGIQRAALQDALALIQTPSLPPEVLAELAGIAPFVLDEDDLAQTTRADFLVTLDSIESIERLPTLPERIDQVLDNFYSQRPLLDEGEHWDDEGRLAERRRQMHMVLDGHPQAWDAAETVRGLSTQTARYMKLDCQEAQAEDVASAALWQHLPPQLQPHFEIEWFGDSDSATAAREAARTYGARFDDESASEEQLAAARDAFLGIRNPLGLLLGNALQPTDLRHFCRECQELGTKLAERVQARRETV